MNHYNEVGSPVQCIPSIDFSREFHSASHDSVCQTQRAGRPRPSARHEEGGHHQVRHAVCAHRGHEADHLLGKRAIVAIRRQKEKT